MKAKVFYFAILREKMRASEAEWEFHPGETVYQLAQRILAPVMGEGRFADCLMFAVGDEYVARDHKIQEREEIALIPPVAGG